MPTPHWMEQRPRGGVSPTVHLPMLPAESKHYGILRHDNAKYWALPRLTTTKTLVGDSESEYRVLFALERHDRGFVGDRNDADTAVGRANSDDDTLIAHWHSNLPISSAAVAPIVQQTSNGSGTKPPFHTVIQKLAPLQHESLRCKPEWRPNYKALRNRNYVPLSVSSNGSYLMKF